MSTLDQLRGGVVISCQPLPDEPDDPMRDPYVQARVAASAVRGGAVGLRVNGTADISAVGRLCEVPIIGLVKDGSGPVVITPTAEHAVAAVRAGASIVAVDATARPRPDGRDFADTVRTVHDTTGALVLADIATFDEGTAAVAAGADAVATTLAGYTADTAGREGPAVDLLAALATRLPVPVIAEGRYRTADDVTRALDAGAHAVVVGNAVTSPLWLTRHLIGGITRGPV